VEWKRTDKTECVTFLTNTVGPDIVDEQVVVTLLWYCGHLIVLKIYGYWHCTADRLRTCVCVCVCACVRACVCVWQHFQHFIVQIMRQYVCCCGFVYKFWHHQSNLEYMNIIIPGTKYIAINQILLITAITDTVQCR